MDGPLSPKEFREFKLEKVVPVNHDSQIYRFSLPDPNVALNMTIASCVVTKANIKGEDVIRPYTPISTASDKGFFDMLVKTYPDGKMSQHIKQLKVGESLAVKGPFEKINVTTNFKKHVGMIAGGSGLTPMLQVIQHMLADTEDKTKITFLYANNTKEDCLLKATLDKLSEKHERFTVHYVLSKEDEVPSGWNASTGFVGADLIKKSFPTPSGDNIVFVCGPPPMMKAISGDKNPDKSQGEVTGILKDLGYSSDNVFKF